jgi:hypothetical protein
MDKRIFSLIIASGLGYFIMGCSQSVIAPLPQESATTTDNQDMEDDDIRSKELNWLNYADPKADANLAIEKQDFTLLAFAGRVTSFPGIESESSALQQQCGYRLLANSSDALKSENELKLRKKLYQYAATYNQLVAAACQTQ